MQSTQQTTNQQQDLGQQSGLDRDQGLGLGRDQGLGLGRDQGLGLGLGQQGQLDQTKDKEVVHPPLADQYIRALDSINLDEKGQKSGGIQEHRLGGGTGDDIKHQAIPLDEHKVKHHKETGVVCDAGLKHPGGIKDKLHDDYKGDHHTKPVDTTVDHHTKPVDHHTVDRHDEPLHADRLTGDLHKDKPIHDQHAQVKEDRPLGVDRAEHTERPTDDGHHVATKDKTLAHEDDQHKSFGQKVKEHIPGTKARKAKKQREAAIQDS